MSKHDNKAKGQNVGDVGEKARALMVSALGLFTKADAAMSKSTDGRKGGYKSCVEAAIVTNDKALFEQVADRLFADVRANKDGIAAKAGCKRGKGRKGKPNPGFLIPASLMSAKSVILAAFDYKVPMIEKDDEGDEAPRSFTAIRSEVSEHKAAETVAGLEGRERDLYLVRAYCAEIAENADAFTEGQLPDVLKALAALAVEAKSVTDADMEKGSKGRELADTDAPDYEADDQAAAA